jgi:hypothetical protein
MMPVTGDIIEAVRSIEDQAETSDVAGEWLVGPNSISVEGKCIRANRLTRNNPAECYFPGRASPPLKTSQEESSWRRRARITGGSKEVR